MILVVTNSDLENKLTVKDFNNPDFRSKIEKAMNHAIKKKGYSVIFVAEFDDDTINTINWYLKSQIIERNADPLE